MVRAFRDSFFKFFAIYILISLLSVSCNLNTNINLSNQLDPQCAILSILSSTSIHSESEGMVPIILSLNRELPQDLEVNYTIGGDVSSNDYIAAGTITLPAGQSAVTIDIELVDDGLLEASEDISLTLTSNSLGISIGQNSWSGTIIDNDTPDQDWDFSSSMPIDFNFSRNSSAWFFNSAGYLVQASNNNPRFDHNPFTMEPLGLLVEKESTNLILYSSGKCLAPWIHQGICASTGELNPKGGNSAWRMADGSTIANESHYQQFTGPSTGSFVYSFFVKRNSSNTDKTQIKLESQGGDRYAEVKISWKSL